jgi:Ulp1 family protease
LNFLDYKSILFPINLNSNHWVLAVVDLKNKKLTYYDSLIFYNHATASQILSNLSKFFDDYLALKSGENHNLNIIGDLTTDRVDEDTTNTNKVEKSFKTKEKSICSTYSNNEDNLSEIHNDKFFTGWKQSFPECPKQSNFSDCGVFICKFMDYITRERRFDFSQNDMEYFRILIGVELIKGTVLTV